MKELKHKVQNAIKILKIAEGEAQLHGQPVEIAYSGGKDSDVLLQLAKESGIAYRAIYKNTTIDPKGTIKHVRDNNVEVLQPKMSFFQLIEKKGFPSIFRRFCCQTLKEYKVLDVCAIGIRTEESVRRKKRYTTFEQCKLYSKKESVRQYFPIWDWKLSDVKQFVEDRKIQLAPHYYREDGTIDYTRRLGCQGCPLKSDRGIADFKAQPKMLKAWLRAGVTYTHTHTCKI
ncbi:MAG: phosphoadenosine phosphosulfate reductase family protein [Prevotella sp.]|nr:phosphoadenosine phosphosulfate reductase family protein [Prevotella sp.]